jgi:hypothetical protein
LFVSFPNFGKEELKVMDKSSIFCRNRFFAPSFLSLKGNIPAPRVEKRRGRDPYAAPFQAIRR